jgi:predicted CxxxxCH...CXXCH cytochrome family protein
MASAPGARTSSASASSASLCPSRTSIDAEGHLDGAVQVVFGDRASARGSTPSFDAASGTCAGVACHGAGLEGGSKAAPPPWASGEAPLCGDCHGLPPATVQGGKAHPAAATCGQCHSAVIDDHFQWVDPSLHADGKVEVDR